MRPYIQRLRNLGYDGIIQRVDILRDGVPIPFAIDRPVSEYVSPDHRLTRIHHFFEAEKKEDVLSLEFSGIPAAKTKDSHPSEAPIRITTDYPTSLPVPDIPYWKFLRPIIGNGIVYSAGMSVVISDDAGRLALVRRRDNGLWSFPAGAREPGESIIDTVHREVREETGLEVTGIRLKAVVSGAPVRITYPNGHVCWFLGFTFTAKACGGHLHTADEENLAAEWRHPEEAEKRLGPHWVWRLEAAKKIGPILVV